MSPPSRGAWIEICGWRTYGVVTGSPPSRGAWIEIGFPGWFYVSLLSPPSRGAWIEMQTCCCASRPGIVAPLAGGVD